MACYLAVGALAQAFRYTAAQSTRSFAVLIDLRGRRRAARRRRYCGSSFKVSAAFVAGVFAIGFLDPGAAFIIAALSMVATWLVERYRWRAFLINVAGVGDADLVGRHGLPGR